MYQRMSKNCCGKIFYVMILLSVLCLLFAGFAPMIFTLASSGIDFTQTGQIGDTIGGLMGPFIAIAGVLMTFAAFWAQVRANEIQKEQLGKSFRLGRLEETLKCRNSLQLLQIDIKNVINDINVRCGEIEKFCDDLDKDFLAEIPCERPSDLPLKRYRSLDRNYLYNAVQLFVEEKDRDVFDKAYALLDYYSEGVQMLTDRVYEPYTDEIMKLKEAIPELYKSLCGAIFGLADDDIYRAMKANFEIDSRRVIHDGVICISELGKLLEDEKYSSMYRCIATIYSQILDYVKGLANKGRMLSLEMRRTAETFESDKIKGRFQTIDSILSIALTSHDEDSIIKEFSQDGGKE